MKMTNQDEYKDRSFMLFRANYRNSKTYCILNALKWPASVREQFFKKHCQELPEVNQKVYADIPFEFDPAAKTEELYAIERDIRPTIGAVQRHCQYYAAHVPVELRGHPPAAGARHA